MRHRAFGLLVAALATACSSESSSGPAAVEDSSTKDSTVDAPSDSAIPDVDDSVASDGDAAVTNECIEKINVYRAKVGAPPVTSKSDQVACAADQAKKGALDLQDAGKTTFHKYFGQCTEKYQNECWYSVSDTSAVIDWCLDGFFKEGPPETGINHYSVMTDPKSTQVACGFFAMPGGGFWMTNDYY